jgi:hypothetical protein
MNLETHIKQIRLYMHIKKVKSKKNQIIATI